MILTVLLMLQSSATWQVQRNVDAMTDEVSLHATTRSIDGSATITYACPARADRGPGVYITTDEFIGGGVRAFRHGLYRVDQRPPVEEDWFHSDHTVMVTAHGRPTKLASDILSGSKLRVRFEDFNGHSKEIDFDLMGARTAIEAVNNSCATKPS